MKVINKRKLVIGIIVLLFCIVLFLVARKSDIIMKIPLFSFMVILAGVSISLIKNSLKKTFKKIDTDNFPEMEKK